MLDGEAGIGKSRLAWEFEKYVDGLAAPVRWHRGRCLSYGDGVAFWALAEALRARFGLVEADSGEVVEARLDAGLLEFVADEGDRDWLRPRLAVLLGASGGGSFAREDLFTAWTAFLEHLAAGQSSVVLVLDDAQHADDGLLDFLDHLLTSAQAPIFVLALARPELLARRPALGTRRASVVHLDPLPDPVMATLVDGLVAGLPAASRAALVARADGIPLYAVETVRALIDRDLVVPREGRYVPAAADADLDLDAIGAPASLQALVAARLDALTPAERRVVTDASVLGESFTLDGLLALGADPQDLQGVLESLRRKEIVTLQTDRFSAERGQYRFVQSVVRQVAHATQSRRDRTTRHLAAAEHLAGLADPGDDLAVVIAQHLLDAVDAATAEDPDSSALTARACSFLERAAIRARRVGAPGEAQRLLEVAISHTEVEADRARLHLSAADVSDAAGHSAEARVHAEAALLLFDRVQDPIGSGRAAAALSYSTLGNNSASVAIAEPRWRDLEGVAGAERARFELARALTSAHAGLGDLDIQVQYAGEMLVLAEALDDPEALPTALGQLGTAFLRAGGYHGGVILLESAAVIAREHDLPFPLTRVLTNLAAFLNSRDLPAALRHAEQARDVARRAGLRPWMETAVINSAVALWCSGRLADVADLLPEGLDGTDPQARIAWRTFQIWLAEARGEPVPAPVADDDTDSELNLAWLGVADLSRAVRAGDHAEATRIAPLVLDHLLAAAGLDDDFFLLWPHLVLAALAAGDLDLAEDLVAPVTAAMPGQRSAAVTAQWHRLRGLLAAARGDDPQLAESEMLAGIEALAAFGARGFHAQAQEELARWLETRGRAGEAEPLVDAARATYAEIGAAGWLAALDAWDSTRAVSATTSAPR
jgi:hypothetical protein